MDALYINDEYFQELYYTIAIRYYTILYSTIQYYAVLYYTINDTLIMDIFKN